MHIVPYSDHILEIHDTKVVIEFNDRGVDDVMEACFVDRLSLSSVCEHVDVFCVHLGRIGFLVQLVIYGVVEGLIVVDALC